MSDSLSSSASIAPFKEAISLKTAPLLRSYDIRWDIENFILIEKAVGEYIESSKFNIGIFPRAECVLRLYPNGCKSAGKISIYFVNLSNAVLNITYTISVLNSEGTKIHSLKSGLRQMHCDTDWGFNEFISRTLLKEETKMLNNGTLTILFELQALETVVNSCSQGTTNSLDKLSEDLEKLMFSESSDITITATGASFKAHKLILGARSPVFAAMLSSGLEESRSDAVEVKDVGADVMRELIRFIYTGRCYQLEGMAGELLRVADKYDVSGLKELCEAALLRQLNVEEAADTLILADLYNANDLKVKTLEFIMKNSRRVVASDSWKNMVLSHPHLELEGLRAIAYRKLQVN